MVQEVCVLYVFYYEFWLWKVLLLIETVWIILLWYKISLEYQWLWISFPYILESHIRSYCSMPILLELVTSIITHFFFILPK